ncbi:MAG: 1-phosphofructokinase family hexose kinase [Bryobacterales bacterium]|nr:1-phosphofructokinase family hexose kinase [Bryobacteraceae bacterium]MDW8131931.1 1-phosphofructokinase family hexose kinase [Bryobacterales bacterium]
MVNLIVTLTINPAIDRTITTDRLVFEDRTYILDSTETAGGRGINASRVLHSFGASTLAVATAGGDSGRRFERHLQACGFPFELVPIASEIRTNLAITDRQGLTIKLNELGPELQPAEVERVQAAVLRRLEGAEWLMLCGSLPPGVPETFYASLIRLAHEHNVKTLLDTDGPALRTGIAAGPTVVAPNQQEAERLLETALVTRGHARRAAERIRQMGAGCVVLSLGSRGAVGAFPDGIFEAVPPPVKAVCPIGAGDALAAAFVWAWGRGADLVDALRWAVAAGTASATLPGVQFASLPEARQIYDRLEVRRISGPSPSGEAAGRSVR